MGENVKCCEDGTHTKQNCNQKPKKATQKIRCKKAKKEEIDLVYKILRKYQLNLKKDDINYDNNLYLIDDDNMRIAHLGKIAPKQYILYCVSKLPEARGPKNIHFLYEVVAYMFLYTDAIIVDTFICKTNKKSIFAARVNPGWELVGEEAGQYHFRWKIGDCYQHVSPYRQKIFLKKLKETFGYET